MTKAQACVSLDGAAHSRVSTRALCRRYALGMFDVAVVRSRDAAGLRDLPVHWAFGWLPDGECEPLGVWLEPGRESTDAFQPLADLNTRGLERIRHVAGADVGRLREQAAAAFSSAGGPPPVQRVDTHASAAARRHAPDPLELAAEGVRAALARAIRRRGSFASAAAALDFISGALQRIERRLDRERAIAKVRPRHESGAQMVRPGF